MLVSDAADEAGVGRFGFFWFALAGIPLLIGTVVIAVMDRRPGVAPSQRRDPWRRTSAPWPRPWPCDYNVEEDELYSRHEGVAEFVVPPGPG